MFRLLPDKKSASKASDEMFLKLSKFEGRDIDDKAYLQMLFIIIAYSFRSFLLLVMIFLGVGIYDFFHNGFGYLNFMAACVVVFIVHGVVKLSLVTLSSLLKKE